MTMISDEIRELIDDEDLYPRQIAGLRRIADRIDAELVELPRDMDGAPIHVGDTVYTTDGSKAYVERICIMANTTHVKCALSDGRIIEFQPTELTHTRPDSWERIADELDEMVDAASNADDTCERLADLAGRIRKLRGED